VELSEDDKALIRDHLERGEPLPDRFRFTLFREPREAELIWPGKTNEVTNVVLPFQSIEQIDEPRVETGAQVADLFQIGSGGRQAGGWSNKLIWGDNKLVLSSLKGGPLRREIEAAGGLKLVYIDPPFDVGADFSIDISVGEDVVTKTPSVIEEVAYRDTWGRGKDSYFAMMNERLRLIHDLLAPDGSIFVHCDYRVNSGIRIILDEIFGRDNLVNEVIWWYKRWSAAASTFQKMHDNIYFYSKGKSYTFNQTYQPLAPSTEAVHGQTRRINVPDEDGRLVTIRTEEASRGVQMHDVWEVPFVVAHSQEQVGYPTQKPVELMSRMIEACSSPGDLVADFFCGSGSFLAAADGLRSRKVGNATEMYYVEQRKWIGADLGRFAIHTSRKRLIGVQRELKAAGKPWRSFEILNLGKYERQWFAGIDPTLPPDERARAAASKEAAYVALILEAYRAQPVEQSPPFHGHKDNAFVVVGPLDAPVNELTVAEAVDAARRMGTAKVDVLGFEFEMGLAPRAVDEAKAKGVAVALRYIPKDVFDRRAVEKGQVSFHDLAYVEAKASLVDKKARKVTVFLSNFAVAYRQDGLDNLIEGMRPGSKVAVENGQVVKLTKAKDGTVTREVLTGEWTDWIDYWAVDFDYASRPENILETITQPDGSVKHVQQWTGRYIFENEWQSFRTRRNRKLELESAAHEYATPGRKQIAVKVIDIFGNDTTKVIGIEV
jgi:adenine-specific DNA-methyltransferase